jgi:hypothetical protein
MSVSVRADGMSDISRGIAEDGGTPIRGTRRLDPTRSPKTVDWTDAVGVNAVLEAPAARMLL